MKPTDGEAEFPQFVPQKHIDFRSSAIPHSGNEHRGGQRKRARERQVTQVIESNITEMMTKSLEQERQEQEGMEVLQVGGGDDDVEEFTQVDMEKVMNNMEGLNILSKQQKKKKKKQTY